MNATETAVCQPLLSINYFRLANRLLSLTHCIPFHENLFMMGITTTVAKMMIQNTVAKLIKIPN